MQNERPPIGWNKVKLFILAAIVIPGLPLVLFLVNKCLHFPGNYLLPNYLIFIIAYLPIITLMLCVMKNGGFAGFGEKLTLIKYYKHCPLFFYYDPLPLHYELRNIDKLKEMIQPGDVLLRRHHRYLDGLVLQQTGYFTHAALYFGEHEGKTHQIMHAMGESGVCFIDLQDFAKCDDIMLLRFNFDLSIEASKFRRKTLPEAPL